MNLSIITIFFSGILFGSISLYVLTYTISNAKELQQEKFLTSCTTTIIIPQGAAWREVISEDMYPQILLSKWDLK
jgi:hypothetical protein